jgi:hypothetical protein
MATKLIYPKLPYVRLGLWTLRSKIHYYTGFPPSEIITWSDAENLYVQFAADLTQEQIDWISDLVNRPDVQGPDTDLIVTNNSYVVYDIWERRDIIAAQAGFDFRIWWDSSGDLGPNVKDKIIYTPVNANGAIRILTTPQKKALVNAIGQGNGWE